MTSKKKAAPKVVSGGKARWGGLTLKRDGTVAVSSKSHVAAANARIVFLDEQIELQVAPLREERDKLAKAVDQYVISHYEASDGYEDDDVKLTKVVGYRRSWNPAKLQKLLPTSLYKLIIKVSVDAEALNELVKEGKIDRKKIESAYEETPNAPYVKRTVKGTGTSRASDEAAELAAKLA